MRRGWVTRQMHPGTEHGGTRQSWSAPSCPQERHGGIRSIGKGLIRSTRRSGSLRDALWRSGRLSARSRACPLTACCGRYHEESGGANTRKAPRILRTRRVRAHALGGLGASFGRRAGLTRTRRRRDLRRRRSPLAALTRAIGLRRVGVLCAPEADPALNRGLGPCRRGRHNVTPREDYRTAVLSDSPDTGCSLSAPAAGAIAGTARAD